MPIARYQLEDGRVARFEVPEGTTPEQAQQIGVDFFANQQQAAPIQAETAQARKPGRSAGARGRAEQSRAKGQRETEALTLLRSQAQESGVPLARDLEEIGNAPELNELSLPSFLASAGALFTFDDEEVGSILTKQLGAKIDQDIEGNFVATFPSGETFAINKPNFSGQDVAKLAGAIGAFTPAGRAGKLSTLPGLAKVAGASGATQAAIETGQAALGGEFDPEQVALSAAAVPVVAGALKGATGAISSLRKGLNIPAATPSAPTTATAQLADDAAPIPKKSIGPLFGQESPTKLAIKDAIEKGEADNITAKYIIDGAGKVRSDPIARSAIKQGFDEGTIAAVKGSQKADKTAFNKMLDIVEKGKLNKKFALKFRPSDIVGDSLVKRFRVVNSVNKKAGKALDGVAKGLQGSKVDLDGPASKFLDDLDDLGVTFADDGSAIFTDSAIEGSTGAENLINKVLPRLQRLQENPDALAAHRLKRFIDTQVEFGKISKDGLTNETANIVKGLRRNVNETLRELSPEYKQVNTQFAETKEVLDAFQAAAGKSINLAGENADKALGVLSRRLLSNVQSRVKLMDSITALENVGVKFGGKFDDDIFTQVMFVDELENHFKAFAPTSLQGVTEKAIKQAGSEVRGGLTEIAISAGAKAAEKARRINEANALKSLRALVNKAD